MSVEKSEHGALTTNAYTNSYNDVSVFRIIDSQWEYRDVFTLEKSIYILGDGQTDITCYAVSWAGTYLHSSDNPLEWAIDIYDSTGNTRLFISDYYSPNKIIDVGLPTVSAVPNTDFVYRAHLYVKRKNGQAIYKEDMYASTFTWYLNHSENITGNTLPSNWFETTTQTIPTYTTQTTMLTTVDYEGYLSTLTIPLDVRPAIATLDQLINDLWSLHYIPFVVCFALIMGLAIWLLH